MANFKIHITIATITSAVLSGTLLTMSILSPFDALVALGLGVIAGIAPDIDSEHSKSARLLYNVLAMSSTALWISMMPYSYSMLEMLISSAVIFVLIRFGLVIVFRWFSVHRGMLHSLPVALVLGLLVLNVSYYFFGLCNLMSWIYGVIVTINYTLHLFTDELSSIDLPNLRIKNSLGSALKLFRIKTTADKFYSFIIYFVLLILLSLAPSSQVVMDTLFMGEEKPIQSIQNKYGLITNGYEVFIRCDEYE